MKMKFWYCTDDFRQILDPHGVYFSEQFCNFFADKIEEIFLREAGLKPSFKVGLSVFRPNHDLPMYEPGPVSRINTALSILPYYEDNISFCWRSKSGKIVRTDDEKFDEDDLECWIEGLKPAAYFEEVNKVATDHPLKFKELPYELIVHGVGTHMGLAIKLADANDAKAILTKLLYEVERHNRMSEANNRKNGVVHNCAGEVQYDMISFRIDVGSAGVPFVRKILLLLAKFPTVTQVIVDL